MPLFVHSGIASSDTICCARLGEHAQGEDRVTVSELTRSVRAAEHLLETARRLGRG